MTARNLIGAAGACQHHQNKASEQGATAEEMADWHVAADRMVIS
ncbi:MAG: hypothetical protein ACP5IL_17715 [Syntrophobacteraceae bacterium]